MYLLAAATDMELAPVKKALSLCQGVDFLKTGVGPVNAAYSLARYLAENKGEIDGVINFGVAGAYLDSGLNLLDVCLAESEILADLGICIAEVVDPFDEETLDIQTEFDLSNPLFDRVRSFLQEANISFRHGPFVTVNCVSGTSSRGNMLRVAHKALCENMEGAAVARVCHGFGIDCLELRSVSNLVEDRDPSAWQLVEACEAAGLHAAQIVKYLLKD
ncbi:MAG: futalosine hydrolase [Desulfobulbaceae bacterium]|uniref:Futalosine hydrolase n=1 Tax=Candidatus Desulfobia pelagia TaxID=2841692 RepID=A0A8J6NEU5_9BACT|nr:futalosine hydrolase [Candidatus Desulfobia pelagia]